jgi:hypothetical protein
MLIGRFDSGVSERKFKIGQLVYFHPKGALQPQLDAVPGPYQITKRLPAAEDGVFQYEIRNTLETAKCLKRTGCRLLRRFPPP